MGAEARERAEMEESMVAASRRLFSDSRLMSLHWRGGCSNLSPSVAPTSRPFSTLCQDQGVPAFVLRFKYQFYFCFKLTTSSTSSSSMSPLGDLEEENLESNETESPYNLKTPYLETRELKLEEDANGVDSASFGFYFQNESKWDDHSSYGAKKTQQAWCKLSNWDLALGKVFSSSRSETVISLPQGKVPNLCWMVLSVGSSPLQVMRHPYAVVCSRCFNYFFVSLSFPCGYCYSSVCFIFCFLVYASLTFYLSKMV